MTSEELKNVLVILAERASESNLNDAACVMFSLAASLCTGSTRHLAVTVSEWSKKEIVALRKSN